MWKCSACQNENKDEYRYCLSCGNPRPKPEVPRPQETKAVPEEKRKSRVVTVLLLILSLLLIVAIIAIIVNFPKLSGKAETEREDTEESSRSSRHSSSDKSDWGGTSSFVFGKETASPTTDAPAESQPVSSSEIVLPTASPLPTVEPSPVPTATPEPVSAGDYLIPGSDSRYITDADLKNLTWEQCCLARNEIFARHGRMFVTTEIANYFNSKSWYTGTISAANFSESVLNEYEKANVNYISQYETAHWGGSYY